MNKRGIIILIIVTAVALVWVGNGIYLGHKTETWAASVPGKEGKTDHPMMICRYFDLDGYTEIPMWPPGTDPNTLLWPDGEKPHVAVDGCPNRWPWG